MWGWSVCVASSSSKQYWLVIVWKTAIYPLTESVGASIEQFQSFTHHIIITEDNAKRVNITDD